jgi:predicted SprT family Zn-dependent metalloprotease
MDIPKTFELMGQTISVKFVSELLQESDTLGQASYRTGEIKILENSPTYKVTKEKQMQIFLHELMHWIFYKLNKEDLCKDEDLVDMVAGLLLQTLKTMKGSIK